ncbi:MAG: hypothetical protein GYB65_17545 [Chloroflexi bacterium]|nr:hypothetical protein [Chloroflexota bacterium]
MRSLLQSLSESLDRAAVASWGSVIGTVALLVGGLVLLFTGELSVWVFLCAVIGVGGLALWMWWAPGEFQAWLSGRQTRFGTTSILVTVLFTGVIIYAYVLVDRANLTTDLTSVRRYSLSTQTLDAIDELKGQGYQVRLVGFFSRRKLPQEEEADLILRQYEAAGDGSIEVVMVDPDADPDLAALHGYNANLDGTLFLNVLDSEGELRIETNEFGDRLIRPAPLYLGSVNERNVTFGIKTIASAGQFTIYFTTGHGERDLSDIGDEGISRLVVSLLDQGIGAVALDLMAVADTGIPADADAVLIVGARQPFSEAEVQVLRDYMDGGGRLGIFADPPVVDPLLVTETPTTPDNTFLLEGSPLHMYLWDEFGIAVQQQLVIENTVMADNPIITSEFTPIVFTIAPHEIMSTSRDAGVVLHYARTMDYVERSEIEPTVQQQLFYRQPLLVTSRESFGETDLPAIAQDIANTEYVAGEDQPGPVVMGMTAKRNLEFQEEFQPRVVIIGDSDVVKNEFVAQIPGNVFLWTDIIDWLTGFSEAMEFTPVNDPTLLNVVASDQERTTISLITLVVLPGIVLASGLIVWWYRQR